MKRRGFLKLLGALTATSAVPVSMAKAAATPELVPIYVAVGGRGRVVNLDGGTLGRGSGPAYAKGTREEARKVAARPDLAYLFTSDKRAWEQATINV